LNSFSISNKQIGPGCEPFLILEAGINHNGEMQLIRKMIATASETGADALKFQTFKATEFISNPQDMYTYYSQGQQTTEPMLEMFQRYELTTKQWNQIVRWCKDAGLIFFSTPQNPSDLDFLISITDLPVIKVGSDDLTNIDLLRYYALKKIPMIISAGMAYISEIETAVKAIRNAGNDQIAVLHCVSSYPAQPEELNLFKLNTISLAFDLPVGFSDHTVGCTAAAAATALGACIFEKHFTIDKNLPGPDHWFSANPSEAKTWVDAIRDTFKSLGNTVVEPTTKELEMRKLARRSIVAARDLDAGTILQSHDIAFKRPGTGLAPSFVQDLIGLQLLHACKKDTIITLQDVRGNG
jgi:N,N'-diacetyllegionaminate synthase